MRVLLLVAASLPLVAAPPARAEEPVFAPGAMLKVEAAGGSGGEGPAWHPELGVLSSGNGHSCALLADGTVSCWGNNNNGQLGDGSLLNSSLPVAVSGVDNATAIAVGSLHSCALLADASVSCWGYNSAGQLGNGTIINSALPTAVIGLQQAAVPDTNGGNPRIGRNVVGHQTAAGHSHCGHTRSVDLLIEAARGIRGFASEPVDR